MEKRKRAVLFFGYVTFSFFLLGIPISVFYLAWWGVIGNMLGAFYTLHFISELKQHSN